MKKENKQEYSKDQITRTKEWKKAYIAFRPLLFSAFGRLVRQGYPVDPSEANEYIHDFLSEKWLGLNERYDPLKAKFSTYLYSSFMRFVRPRIIKKYKWRASLVDPFEIENLRENVSNNIEISIDLEKVKASLEQLPDDSRKILETLTDTGYSERKAAAKLGVSRYRFRCLATEALARFAVEINIQQMGQNKDLPLARAIWADGKSLEDAATSVGISIQCARIVRRRILRLMEEILSEFSSMKVSERRGKTMSLCELWKQFVFNQKDQMIVDQIRNNAEKLFLHLQECEDCNDLIDSFEPNIAVIYEAIGAIMELTPAEIASLEENDLATVENNNQVQIAIESSLLPALPPPLVSELLSWIKPKDLVTVFISCESIAMRIHRHRRHDFGSNFVLGKSGLRFDSTKMDKKIDHFIERTILIEEMCSFSKNENETSEFLFDWIIAASRSYPKLMIGVEVVPEGTDSIRVINLLNRDPSTNLFEYWKPTFVSQQFPLEIKETERIKRVLLHYKYNIKMASRVLGISRSKLAAMIRQFGL